MMKILVIVSLAIAAVLAAPAEDSSAFIVGGVNAIPGEFPYIVSLHWVILGVSSHVCGGSIISSDWVLSAAHCLTETPSLGRLDILAGLHSQQQLGEASRVGINRGQSIIHPDFVSGGQVGPDDLVLIRLASPITFNPRIRTVQIPQPEAIPTGPATLSGWGSTGGLTPPAILQKAILSTISIEACRAAMNNLGFNGTLVDYTNFCTGPLTGGLSACSGDSGGPIVQGVAPNEVVIGVVSWGISPCGSVGAPSGVFKRVSAYNDWIFQHTGVRAPTLL